MQNKALFNNLTNTLNTQNIQNSTNIQNPTYPTKLKIRGVVNTGLAGVLWGCGVVRCVGLWGYKVFY